RRKRNSQNKRQPLELDNIQEEDEDLKEIGTILESPCENPVPGVQDDTSIDIKELNHFLTVTKKEFFESQFKGYIEEEMFIASQAPTRVMINDFVRLLWEQRIEKIVMLTNVTENGKRKSEQYWPDEEKVFFGDIKVSLKATQVFADYTVRSLELSKKPGEKHTLTQFHFTSWPDKDVPPTPWSLVEFQYRVNFTPTSKPVVVHCSAGVGRTGTYIALNNIMKQAVKTGRVDFFKTVTLLRQNRIFMVQTASQYEFLHKAAQLAIICIGATLTSNVFCERYKSLHDSKLLELHLESEYTNLKAVCDNFKNVACIEEKVYQNTDGIAKETEMKMTANLNNEDQNGKLILEKDSKETGYYMDAILISGFKQKGHHILAQPPLSTTVIDFWRLVTQHNISLVVACENLCQYLPPGKEEHLICTPFEIKRTSLKCFSYYEESSISVTSKKNIFKTESHRVVFLNSLFTDLDVNKMLSLLKQARSYSLNDGKVLYMCKDGATFSGVVFVLSQLVDRLDYDSCLTVPIVVGATKCLRPEVIPNQEQYVFIHKVLQRYIDITCNYNNVGEDFLQKGIFKHQE
ncbi:hypothetical protein Btru_050099, partial [Bulinus truncatus]